MLLNEEKIFSIITSDSPFPFWIYVVLNILLIVALIIGIVLLII